MRDFAGLGNLGRGLPEGIVRLVLLAVLICLAVFTTGAPATEGPEAEAPEPAPVDVLIVDGEQVLTGNDSKEYRVVEVTDEGRLLILGDGKLKANERVELTGAAAITGKELVVGTQTLAADMPPWGGLYTKTLERGSDEARLFFETATINPGADDFNLGAIKRDADGEYYEGGIYVGDGWLEAEEALNVKTLAATNDNHDATVGATAKIWVNGDVVLTAGGTIGLAGHEFGSSGIAGARVDENGDNPDGVYSHAFVMDGGVLNMNGTTGGDGGKYDVYGAELQMKDVFISGGTVNLSAGELYRTGEDRDWANAPAVVGSGGGAGDTGVFVVSGGTVNLGDYGTIRTQWAEEGLAGAMTISGGIVNMSGSEDKHAVIRAASPHDAGPNENEAVLNIAGDATINVEAGKYGVVMSRNTQFTGGEINVDGTLVVTGSAGTGETVMDGIAHEDHVKWGDFHFNGPGGVMAIGDAGVVDFVSGGVTVKGTAGRIDGTLRVVDSPDDVGTKGAGVYASAVRIEKGADGDVFTVEELELWTAGDGGGARAGVDIDGRLVITGGVGAVEDVAKGSLVIGGRGSLTADAADFLTFTDVSDDLDVTGYTVDAALAAALSGSTGTLNLNAQNPEVAYNITSEQYAAIKNMLGMTGGKLNLLGVVVDDTLRLAPEPDGTIGVAVANPSATVTIDASGLDDGVGGLVFLKDVSVKEIALEKGEAIEKLTLTQSGVFTGSGNKNTAIIGGGKSDAVGIDAKAILAWASSAIRTARAAFSATST